MSTEKKVETELINRTIILNTSNIVSNTGNSRLSYRFNESLQLRHGDKIALASLSIYNSWFNIDGSKYNNNIFSYKWFNSTGVLNVVVNVTIPNGYYDLVSLQLFLESEFYKNGHYLQNITSGLNEYYITFIPNSIQYAIQLYCNPIPSSLLDGGIAKYIKPSGLWQLPTIKTCPQVIISNMNNFYKYIGFAPGTFPSTIVTDRSYTALSTACPQVSPVSGILLKCDLVKNDIMNPSDVLFQFSNGGISFGSLITVQPPSLLYIDVNPGFCQDIRIEMVDQNLQSIIFKDPSMIFMLSILSQN
jgi:hypothetical protein